jgi:exopolysaccharide biosynthesis protein
MVVGVIHELPLLPLSARLAASQSEAEQTLVKLGAECVAMLDGGQSTGLIVGGKSIMQPKTRIPQTIGIFTK